MEAVLVYFGKMLLTSGLMYGYYQLLLKDKTFHHYNRFYLLSTLFISLLLPLLKVSYFTIPVNNDLYLLINKLRPVSRTVDNDTMSFSGILAGCITLISLLFALRFAQGILEIVKLKRRFPKELIEGIGFYRTDLDNAPFSYFRDLFWRNDIPVHSDLGQQIMKHEMAHIEQKHTYDKMVAEAVRAVFWFNPFFHLIKKEIHLIHEYLADHKAIKRSDTKAFAQMLLASHFSGNAPAAASPFLNTHLKKRLQMIKTSKTRFSYARKALALPLLFSITFACVVHAQNREIKAANSEMDRAADQTGRTRAAAPDIVAGAGNGNASTEALERSLHDLQLSELKIEDLDQQLRDIERTRGTHDEVFDEAAAKFDQAAALGEKIDDPVDIEAFKKAATAIHERAIAALGAGELALMTEKLAISDEAEALERARIAMWDAAAAKVEAKLLAKEVARAKEAAAAALEEAEVAMKEAASARAEAALMQKEAARARSAADIARKEATDARREAARSKEQASDH